MDVLGKAGLTKTDGDFDEWQRLFLFSRADTIYGGSNEIQRNIIAERVLGLPREVKGAMTLSEAPKEVDGHGLLTGKVVVVTAAAGTGIGSAVARRALAEGADVVISDHHERRLGETRDQLPRTRARPGGERGVRRDVQCAGRCAGGVDDRPDGTTRRAGEQRRVWAGRPPSST